VESRPAWSDRRRRTLLALALGIVAFGLGAVALPDEYGVSAGFLAALCAFLLAAATVVFVVVPGPGTLRTLFHTVSLAGAVLVVSVLLLLSTSSDLRWLWSVTAVAAAGWTATAVWGTRRSGR
jgi:hypothetical protein